MPGLSGALGPKASAEIPETGFVVLPVSGVRNGVVSLAHHGATPTGHGIYSDPEDGVVVAFWGEFYHDEWENAATGDEIAQAISERLEAGVEKTLRELNGSFSLFAQLRDGDQILATDRLASRPIYYRIDGDTIFFAPHPRLAGRGAALDYDAILTFAINGHALHDQTYFRDVKLLPTSHVLRRRNGVWTASEYRPYVVCDPEAPELTIDAYCDEFMPLLRRVLRSHSRYVESSVVPISGGWDSRMILAGIREFYSGPLTTVTWGTHEDDPEADGYLGRRVAERFGTNHHFFRRPAERISEDLPAVTREFDLANDDCLLHHHEPATIRHIRHELGCRVLYRGDYCFGYSGPAGSAYEALGRLGIAHVGHYRNVQAILHPARAPQLVEQQRAGWESLWANCPYQDWTIVKDWLFIVQRTFRSLNASHYAKLTILEARNPFLDGRVFEFYAKVPPIYRPYKALFRRAVNRMFPELMRDIPIATKASLEDWDVVLRQDAKFRQLVESRLFAGDSPLFEIFDREGLRRAVTAYFDGPSEPPLRSRLIESAKTALRTHAGPVYRALKKTGGPKLALREFPLHLLVGRCLAMRIWLDENA
jgi:asparagine synthetase B (glutamine-hydrolysing)